MVFKKKEAKSPPLLRLHTVSGQKKKLQLHFLSQNYWSKQVGRTPTKTLFRPLGLSSSQTRWFGPLCNLKSYTMFIAIFVHFQHTVKQGDTSFITHQKNESFLTSTINTSEKKCLAHLFWGQDLGGDQKSIFLVLLL